MRLDGIIIDSSFAELLADIRHATEEDAPLKRSATSQRRVTLNTPHPELLRVTP